VTTVREPPTNVRPEARREVGQVDRPPAQVRTTAPRAKPAATVMTANLLAWTLAMVSMLGLAFLAFVFVLSPLQQHRSQDLLYTQLRSELAAATAPFGVTAIRPGAPVAILDIADLGLRQVVVQGTAGSDLRTGPGHARDTVLPGQVGTTVLFGRSTTYGAPFTDITTLARGQRIRVVTGQGAFVYRVEDVRHDGDAEPPALTGIQSRLVLVTTEGSFLRPSRTVYVDALLASPPTVTPPRSAVFLAPFEEPMASEPSALLPLVLWLLGLIAAVSFVAWGSLRWGALQTWLVGVPLVLAALWGCCDSAALLLPNLM
jgi:sortase A